MTNLPQPPVPGNGNASFLAQWQAVLQDADVDAPDATPVTIVTQDVTASVGSFLLAVFEGGLSGDVVGDMAQIVLQHEDPAGGSSSPLDGVVRQQINLGLFNAIETISVSRVMKVATGPVRFTVTLARLAGSGTVRMTSAGNALPSLTVYSFTPVTVPAGTPPPGTWTQLGKGPTSIANNTETTVLADQSLAAGQIPQFLCVMKTTPTMAQYANLTSTMAAVSSGNYAFTHLKKLTGLVDFRIKHIDGGARDFDWVVSKVVPA